MGLRLTLKTAPTVEPLTVAEAKKHLNIMTFDDDSYITTLITAARMNTEKVLHRALITQTWNMYFDKFESIFSLANPPLQSVTSIKYIDTSGAEQTLSTDVYTVDIDSEPGQVYRSYDESWPDIQAVEKAVDIEYVAGYGDAATDVPAPIKHGMLMLISHMYEHRESVNDFQVYHVPMGYEALLWPYRNLTL